MLSAVEPEPLSRAGPATPPFSFVSRSDSGRRRSGGPCTPPPLGAAFFGIIHKGRLYFKTDSASVSAYRERQMKPFRLNVRQTLKTYYEVPVDIIEDAEELAHWADRATARRRRPKP